MKTRTLVLCVAVLLLAAVPAFTQAPANPTVLKFAPGGDIRLRLSAGAIKVIPGKDDEIRISWTTKDPDKMNDVKIKQRVDRDKEAEIEIDGPHGFEATIELPRKSDLWIRMTAGDLDVGEFVGDKDIELRAGDLEIKSGDKEAYAQVDGSVTTGGLDAPRFDVSKGGLWRSFKHKGNGMYRLYAHVSAGQLTIK
jgi:hypothetical protein